jgi:hypothetical protein
MCIWILYHFHTILQKLVSAKVVHFSKAYYNTIFQDPIFSTISVIYNMNIQLTASVLLLMIGN